MVESLILGVIGVLITRYLYKMSGSLSKIEANLTHAVDSINDHERRLRDLEIPHEAK